MTSVRHPDVTGWYQSKGLARDELAKRSGFSTDQIRCFETGVERTTGKPVSERTWHRFRLVCAALDAGLSAFNWERK
jgi:hypothetical protein